MVSRSSSKSALMRKYEHAYELCMKRASRKRTIKSRSKSKETCKSIASKMRTMKRRLKSVRKSRNVDKSPKKSKNKLNPYQNFVKQQSKKKEFKDLPANQRLKEIAKLWRQK